MKIIKAFLLANLFFTSILAQDPYSDWNFGPGNEYPDFANWQIEFLQDGYFYCDDIPDRLYEEENNWDMNNWQTHRGCWSHVTNSAASPCPGVTDDDWCKQSRILLDHFISVMVDENVEYSNGTST